MCWQMCLYGCFVLGIVRTWEVASVLRKVPRNLGSGVGKVPRFRYAFVWRSSEGVRGNLRAGPTGIRCDALAIRRLGLLRTKTKKLFLVKSVFRVSSLIFFGFRHEECRPVVCFTGCPSCRT